MSAGRLICLALTLQAAHGISYSWEDFSSSDCSGTTTSAGTIQLPTSEVATSNACISHSTISFHSAWCDVSVAPPVYKRVKYSRTECTGRSFNEEIYADGRCHGWPSGSSTKFFCGTNVCLEGQAPASDGRGCPGQVGGCSGDCCLDQPDNWCGQNYASGTQCVNNACGSDDCCVPAARTGAIIGAIVGLIVLFAFVLACACFMTSMRRKNQRASAMQNNGMQFAEGVPVTGTVVANTIPTVQAVAVPF